ncbi:MAG: hypothetical protein HGGPFJEG_02505 [Ignavibacteria bacterium]|nr:hypothetical protein [Ignavibacteria bacterium]
MTKHRIHSRRISLIKGITWRIIGTMDTIFLSWIFTGNIDKAFHIGSIELFTKVILYYFHERAWMIFHIGKRKIMLENGTIFYEDKHWRSFAKGISWRFFGTIDTIIIALFITGDLHVAFEIGFTEVFTKMLLFYFHERFWLRVTREQ